jgi:putative ABC transport system permease protein
MFVLIESVRAAINSINAHRFRALLTSLGIIVGVASIIAIVCVIQGLSASVTRLFQGLGSNNLAVTSFTSPDKQLRGQFARLLPQDLALIRERLQGVSVITPVLFSQVNPTSTSQISYASKVAYTRVIGTTHDYEKLSQLTPTHGRFLTDTDNLTRRRVAVIGEEVRHKLSLPENPTGEYIGINGEWVKIIGLMEAKGDVFGFNQDDYVLLPYGTMQSLIGNRTESDIQILLNVDDLEMQGEIRERIRRLIRTSHRLDRKDEDDFKIQTPEQLLASFSDFIHSVTYFTVGIVSLSLLVGGIGIMNIMLVSVNERTREIGICKAIGAKRYHILLQFLLEALILCLLGGAFGVALGYGVGALASEVLNFPLAGVPLWAVGLSFGFASLVGVAFGILPAAKAANLDPIEALRYE